MFKSHGFETSIDIARRQQQQHQHHVAQLAGHKRPATTDSEPLRLKTEDKKNLTVPRFKSHGELDIQESTPLQSARAALGAPPNRFIASKILPGPNSPGTDPEEDQKRNTSVPPSSQNPLLSLSNAKYGLPPALTANFAALGVKNIYPWQASCLLARGLLEGERHLVYTAPTGGGKSMVADVLLLKRIIENPTRKAILVLPYVALVQEKLKWLRRIVQGVEKIVPDDEEEQDATSYPRRRWKKLQKQIRVTGFFGGSRTTATWADTDIAVCTIEKVCETETTRSFILLMHVNRQIR